MGEAHRGEVELFVVGEKKLPLHPHSSFISHKCIKQVASYVHKVSYKPLLVHMGLSRDHNSIGHLKKKPKTLGVHVLCAFTIFLTVLKCSRFHS